MSCGMCNSGLVERSGTEAPFALKAHATPYPRTTQRYENGRGLGAAPRSLTSAAGPAALATPLSDRASRSRGACGECNDRDMPPRATRSTPPTATAELSEAEARLFELIDAIERLAPEVSEAALGVAARRVSVLATIGTHLELVGEGGMAPGGEEHDNDAGSVGSFADEPDEPDRGGGARRRRRRHCRGACGPAASPAAPASRCRAGACRPPPPLKTAS